MNNKSILKQWFLECAVIWACVLIYHQIPFNLLKLTIDHSTTFLVEPLYYRSICLASFIYTILCFFLIRHHNTKGRTTRLFKLYNHFFKLKILQKTELNKILGTLLLKVFFLPLVIQGTVFYADSICIFFIEHQPYSSQKGFIWFFNNLVFSFLFMLEMCIILGIGAWSYIFDGYQNNSHIRSIETNGWGWVSCVICYAPFIVLAEIYVPFPANDFAMFINPEITFAVRSLLILIMCFKVWAAITLNSRISNLTYRGLKTSGPYRWIRHPHYSAKLLIWWVVCVPAFKSDPLSILFMAIWTSVYVLRAITEENHIMKIEPEYKGYMKKVRYRFIPCLW